MIDVGPSPTSTRAQRVARTTGALTRAIPEQTVVDCAGLVWSGMDYEHHATFEPISIARCREILGHDADELSDIEVDQIRQHADAMAHVIVEIFLEQRAARE